jgi:Homing endonuclease associated repeat
VAKELASPTLTVTQYEERGEFSWRTVISKFGTWTDGLKAAGLNVQNRRHIPNDELFENLVQVWITLGRQPRNSEMPDKSIGATFSTRTYIKRFGSWNEALQAFSEYIQSGQDGFEPNVPFDTGAKSSKVVPRRTPREINWRLRAKVLIKHSCICQMCGGSPAKKSGYGLTC